MYKATIVSDEAFFDCRSVTVRFENGSNSFDRNLSLSSDTTDADVKTSVSKMVTQLNTTTDLSGQVIG